MFRAAGDFDADGLDDLVMGCSSDLGGLNSGAVFVMRGSSLNGTGSTSVLDAADAAIVGNLGARMYASVGPTLDIDGDGRDDLLVDATTQTTSVSLGGAVHLMLSPY